MDNHSPTELELRVSDGCTEALGELLQAYTALYRHIAIGFIKNSRREAVDDAVQDTYLRITMKIDQYDPYRGSFKSWSSLQARKACTQSLRHAAPVTRCGRQPLSIISTDEHPAIISKPKEQVEDKSELTGIVNAMIDELPERERVLLDLVAREGYSLRQLGRDRVVGFEHTQTTNIYNNAVAAIRRKLIKSGRCTLDWSGILKEGIL